MADPALSPFRRFAVLLAAALFASAAPAFAQGPRATAVLSDSVTSVGQPVQLEIQVTGMTNPRPPAEINVDGLDIRSAGTSRQIQMQNFSVSYSFTFTYIIMPLRPGTFTIPSQTIEAGGRPLRTEPLRLEVSASAARPGRPGRSGRSATSNLDPANVGSVDLALPKTTAYVGEMVPVQMRMLLNTRDIESIGPGMQLGGQGFTMQKMPEPRQTMESVNGRPRQSWIFKTAIAAARPGKLEIGPAEINPVVRVPVAGQRNPSLPRDLFDDPFFNNFFNDPAFARTVPKEVKLKSEPASLEVKPLPPDAPPTFTGAVGNFSLRVDAQPKKGKVGDPITVTATISGRGNFDRVTAPVLEEESGWHTYPPSDRFEADDDVGISGAKRFEIVVSPKERKTQLPPLVFSYFDPVKESYVTLKSDPVSLQITGDAAPVATPAATASGAAPAAPAPAAAPKATPAEQDILYQITSKPRLTRSFTPLYAQQRFWLSQLVPLGALIAWVWWRRRQARLGDREAQRILRLQSEAAELQRRMRSEDRSAPEYLADAWRTVQLKTALAEKVDPNVVDPARAADAFHLGPQERQRLQELFERHDELRYSGGMNGNGARLGADDRREIRELVETLK